MHDQLTMDRLETLRGAPVHDTAGDKIGKVEHVYTDIETGQPEWLALDAGGFFGSKRRLVPLAGADIAEDSVTVRYSKDQVKDSPEIGSDELSPDGERELYSYYGVAHGTSESSTVLPEDDRDYDRQVDLEAADRDAGGRETMTRSEEELAVGKRDVAANRLRVHRWVETEREEVPVELRKERARVVREPADGSARGGDIGDDHLEATLREEEPVVEKRVVPKEQIGIERDVETEQRMVGDDVRKERIDVDDDADDLHR